VNDQPIALAVFHPVDVLSATQNAATGRDIATGQELEQGRLAGAVRAHHADDLRREEREVRAQAERPSLSEESVDRRPWLDFLLPEAPP
jgi:hypothetical protein